MKRLVSARVLGLASGRPRFGRATTRIWISTILLFVVFALALATVASYGAQESSSSDVADVAAKNRWTGEANAKTVNASCASYNGTNSDNYLMLTDYDFSIPTTARIDGVVVDLTMGSTVSARTLTVQLVVTGSPAGDALTSSATAANCGACGVVTLGASDDQWGNSLTPALVNRTDFGIRIVSSTNAGTSYVDGAKITVYYTTQSITVRKVLSGTAPGADWQFTGGLGTFTINKAGGTQAFSDLAANTYTITETAKPGYTCSSACSGGETGDRSITVDLYRGDDLTVTFTNVAGGSITVKKVVVGAAPTTNWSFNGGTGIGAFTLPSGGGETTFSNLPIGSYAIVETAKTEYACESRTLPDGESGGATMLVELHSGDNLTVTFTNTKVGQCGCPNSFYSTGMWADLVDPDTETAAAYNGNLTCASVHHIRVKTTGEIRRSYLKFNLVGQSGPVTSATLSITKTGGAGGEVGIYGLSAWPDASAPNPAGGFLDTTQ